MVRTITVLLALTCLAWLSAPAMAQQSMSDCDKWIAKINTEVGVRADEASHAARMNSYRLAAGALGLAAGPELAEKHHERLTTAVANPV